MENTNLPPQGQGTQKTQNIQNNQVQQQPGDAPAKQNASAPQDFSYPTPVVTPKTGTPSEVLVTSPVEKDIQPAQETKPVPGKMDISVPSMPQTPDTTELPSPIPTAPKAPELQTATPAPNILGTPTSPYTAPTLGNPNSVINAAKEKPAVDQFKKQINDINNVNANSASQTTQSKDGGQTIDAIAPNTPKVIDIAGTIIANSTSSNNTNINTNNANTNTGVTETNSSNKPVQEQVTVKAGQTSFPYTIEQLLDMVVQRDASDLHISEGYPVMVRVDGDLTPVSKDIVDKTIAEKLIYPLLTDDKKELLEVNREVDLAYSYGNMARFRINAYYERRNLAAALRMIPSKVRSIDELQLPKIFHDIVKLPQGLVLVTGPTGSGKSTTLAAMINEVNQTQPVHIVTIEDPIEYIYPKGKALIDQREMFDDTHSWEIALKSVLRQDPDVVLVGEMRDFETIAAAITIAETGHLVFATLHTNSASQAVDRVIDVFPEFQQSQIRLQLSNVLEAVISQRLIPIIGGGRRAVCELMLATPAIRNLIRDKKTEQIDNTIRTSADVGMTTLEQALVDVIREGKLTVDDAQKYTTNPDEITRLIKG